MKGVKVKTVLKNITFFRKKKNTSHMALETDRNEKLIRVTDMKQ